MGPRSLDPFRKVENSAKDEEESGEEEAWTVGCSWAVRPPELASPIGPGPKRSTCPEEKREATLGASPGDRDGLDAALGAVDPGNLGMEVGLVLEEVQVPPGALLGVVHPLVYGAAFGARKPGPFGKRNGEVQTAFRLVELHRGHRPRLFQ